MANQKRFVIGAQSGGGNPYICVQRDADEFFWNGSAFIANGGSPYLIAMTSKYPGFWEYETSAAPWDTGTINVTIYTGSSDTDPVLAGYSMLVSGDTLIGFVEASATTSKNTVTALKKELTTAQASIASLVTNVGVLADKIDSLNQVLSRRDYKANTTE